MPTETVSDDLEAFRRAQAAGRRRAMLIAAAAVAGIGAFAFAAARLSTPSPCEAFADQLCMMAGVTDCSTLRSRLANRPTEICASSLEAMSMVADRTLKMAIATKAMEDLAPETAAFNRALGALPIDRKAAFLEKLKAAPEEERQVLIRQLTETGTF